MSADPREPDQTYRMDLSPEERTVVLAMRSDQRAGKAIFGYTLGYDHYTDIDEDAEPWRNAPF